MEVHEYKQIMKEIAGVDYTEFQRHPETLMRLLVRIQDMCTSIADAPEDEDSVQMPIRGDALKRLCKKLRLPTETGCSPSSDAAANELANRVQGWHDLRMADRRANKVVRAAWFAGFAAMISAVGTLLAVLSNPQVIGWLFGK